MASTNFFSQPNQTESMRRSIPGSVARQLLSRNSFYTDFDCSGAVFRRSDRNDAKQTGGSGA
jgi:hypothetical protein